MALWALPTPPLGPLGPWGVGWVGGVALIRFPGGFGLLEIVHPGEIFPRFF